MALTRHATGHSAPRQKPAETTTVSITKKKAGAGRPKANSSKPLSAKGTKVKDGRVEKRGRPRKVEKAEVVEDGGAKTKQKRKPSIKDKVEGVAEKVVGAVEGKPGKKVRFAPAPLSVSQVFGWGGRRCGVLWLLWCVRRSGRLRGGMGDGGIRADLFVRA